MKQKSQIKNLSYLYLKKNSNCK